VSQPKIFISYRRADSAGYTGRLYDRLVQTLEKAQIFLDVDSLSAGEDFAQVIERTLGVSDAFIAVIGKQWLASADGEGKRRLDDPNDLVRQEIAMALKRNILVIPVLVGGAMMPKSSELPAELVGLSTRNAIEISDTRFNHDAEKLIGVLVKALRIRDAKLPSSRWVWWKLAIYPAAWLAIAAAAYLFAPPSQSARSLLPGVVALITGLVAAFARATRNSGSLRLWIAAAATGLVVSAAGVLAYHNRYNRWTTTYDGEPIVVGSELTELGRRYVEKNPQITTKELVVDAAGSLDRVWTKESIERNGLLLATLYLVSFGAAGVSAMATLRVLRL
jgi:hypothetical protein